MNLLGIIFFSPMQFSWYLRVPRMMKTTLLILISFACLSVSNVTYAQFPTTASRSELGFMVGGTYYIGDINPFMPYRNTHLSGGVLYRFTLNPRTTFRTNLLYGKLSGDDSQSKLEPNRERNLSFETHLWELAGGIEFNYFPFQIGHDRYNGTGYILAQIGLFRMNPTAIGENGNDVELQPLGTEGQGTSLTNRGRYSLTQLCIPLGVGARMSLGDRASINFEVGLRKTFTDYIDDIGSDFYADREVLAQENGPLAASMSNRSLSNNRFAQRGDSATKDWYFFSGMMITFRLGSPTNCQYKY